MEVQKFRIKERVWLLPDGQLIIAKTLNGFVYSIIYGEGLGGEKEIVLWDRKIYWPHSIDNPLHNKSFIIDRFGKGDCEDITDIDWFKELDHLNTYEDYTEKLYKKFGWLGV